MKKINKIEFLLMATLDLKEIINYYKRNNSFYANRIVNKINNTKKLLMIFPLIGKKRYFNNVIYHMFKVDDFIMIYMIEDNKILIVRILHDKREINSII